jgi:hypothetical protein
VCAVGRNAIREVIQRVPARIFDARFGEISNTDRVSYFHKLAKIIGSIIIPRIFSKQDGFILEPTDEIMGLRLDDVKIYMIKDAEFRIMMHTRFDKSDAASHNDRSRVVSHIDRSHALGHIDRSRVVGHIDRSHALSHIDRSHVVGHIDRSRALSHIDRSQCADPA